MKTILHLRSLFILLIFISLHSFSQNCGEQFIDSGGIDGNYSNGEDISTTFLPDNNDEIVTLQFLSFETEPCCDNLKIYDGPDSNSPLLGTFVGASLPPMFSSTHATGALTAVFYSDSSVVKAGWVANIICLPPQTCLFEPVISVSEITQNGATINWIDNTYPDPINGWEVEIVPTGTISTGIGTSTSLNSFIATGLDADSLYDIYVRAICNNNDFSFWKTTTFTTLIELPACSGQFVDSGGKHSPYSNSEDITTIICPDINGEVVTVEFLSFNTEIGEDVLSIYDGDSNTSPLLGNFTGSNLPPTFTSTNANGCLTFVFTSNITVFRDGWEANIICALPPTCLEPDNLFVANQTSDSRELNWTDNNNLNATNWEIQYGLVGFELGTGAIISTNSNPFVLGNLLYQTEYEFYVRSDCGFGDYSLWSNSSSFATLSAQPIDYPYDVSPLPFQIYNQPIQNTFNLDDGYSDFIYLNFDFNYFGYNYNKVVVGTNSVISFDVNDREGFCPWQINEDEIIPNANVIDNAVLGAYQDYDNSNGIGSQAYGFIGNAPFRKFVVFFDNVSLFSCATLLSANQMVLYETYNFIDVQVKDRNVCTTWNDGNAIIGIQSIDGAFAYFPQNRNTGDWEAHDEGWRFRPQQDHPEFQYIVCDDNLDGVEVFEKDIIIDYFNEGNGNVYSFYYTLIDAENDVNSIFGDNFVNTSNAQTIFVREIDNGTGEITIHNILLAAIDCTADYDLDNVPTANEDLNGNGNFGDDDTDGDAIPDFIDEDDDGDYVLTNVEAIDTRNTNAILDTDDDQIPNYLDNDDDGDNILSLDEDANGNYNLLDDDTDGDNIPDYLDNEALNINADILNSFQVYPNPVKDILTIEFVNIQAKVKLSIYSLQGSIVYKKQNIQETKTDIDISNLSSGVYFIKLENNDQSAIRKFVKE